MSLLLRDQEMRATGREEGMKEIRRTMVENMLKENESLEKICRYAGCDEAYVETIRKELHRQYSLGHSM